MTNEKKDNQPQDESNKNAAVKPDPETLHTTDPQKKMEGPISSLMHQAGESFDANETKEEATKRKEENM